VESRQDALRKVLCYATANGVPMPAFSSALAYFDAYRSERLPANLLQSQRATTSARTPTAALTAKARSTRIGRDRENDAIANSELRIANYEGYWKPRVIRNS
jgi:hypothetical protein